ncbi:hypothetical protein ACVMAJ_000148 [Bradyrhizobium sp. USDA 4448]
MSVDQLLYLVLEHFGRRAPLRDKFEINGTPFFGEENWRAMLSIQVVLHGCCWRVLGANISYQLWGCTTAADIGMGH